MQLRRQITVQIGTGQAKYLEGRTQTNLNIYPHGKNVPFRTVRCRRELRNLRGLFLQQFFDFGYVFGDVYAYGVVVDFGDADFPAIFEPAELLELLDFLEVALGKGR